jgi:pilus assembly protein CpaF
MSLDHEDRTAQIRATVQRRLLSEVSPSVEMISQADIRPILERIFAEALAEENLPLSRAERNDLFQDIMAEVLGFGPIEPLLRDESVTEILVNGPDSVFIERNGLLTRSDVTFRDNAHVLHIIDRIVAPLGRRVDESSPMVNGRLPDGSRVNIIIPPLALNGPCMSIRKFARNVLSVDDMLRTHTLEERMTTFLGATVKARLNVVVSGGTGTGKTTFLNVLSTFIPPNERIISIEDAAELSLNQPHVVRLESRPPNVEGRGEVGIRQLVINALRMRPDRIIVGEVRGGECLDMLQAMNTGHDGSLTTVHSNGPRDTLARVETMALMSGMDLPLRAIREQIASAFNVIVHLGRLQDGSRKVVNIAEVQGMEGDIVVMQDIFVFKQTGVVGGRVQGHFTATGVRPSFVSKFSSLGIELPDDLFTPTDPGRAAPPRRGGFFSAGGAA